MKFAMYLMVPIGASVIYANHEVMKELSKGLLAVTFLLIVMHPLLSLFHSFAV
jgi:hypothetical protein